METKAKEGYETLYQDYKDLLAYFCYAATRLSKMVAEKESNGTEPDKRHVEYWSEQLRKARKKLLEVKDTLGFPGGLSFLENNTFEGIQIRDGVIYGEPYDALEIAEGWKQSFPAKPEYSYMYEVAEYLKAYCQEDLEDLLPEELQPEKEEKKEKGGIIVWLRRHFAMTSAS